MTMTKTLQYCLTLLILWSSNTLAGTLQTFTLDSQAQTPDGDRAVQLSMECQPGSKGSLVMKLVVSHAYPEQHFDYDSFEGPDPVAGNRQLTELKVKSPQGTSGLHTAIGGWFSAEVEGAFVFATNQYAHIRKDIAKVISDVSRGASTLNWIQHSFTTPSAKIEATFILDESQARNLHEKMAACLKQVHQ